MARYNTIARGQVAGITIRESSPVAPTDWTPKGTANRTVRWLHAYQVAAEMTGTDISAGPRDIPCPICRRSFSPWTEGEVDRVRGESSRYEAGNIALVCWQCNWGRGAMQTWGDHGFPHAHIMATYARRVSAAAQRVGYAPAAGDAGRVYRLRERVTGDVIATRKRGVDRDLAWQRCCEAAGWL